MGTWPVYWYGLMYLIGFFVGWGLLSLRLGFFNNLLTKHHPSSSASDTFTPEQLSDVVFYAALGAIIGGRMGFILFYDWHTLFSDPLLILQIWKGGMSFHGGLLGVLAAMLLCARKLHKPFLALTDLIAPAVPIGLAAGRLGNFINGELWGRVTTMPWGIVFPNAGPLPRHPSQLYEFLLEGVLLFIILWLYSAKPKPLGAVSGLFAIGYGVFRCIAEFFREPDAQIGYIFGWLTEGQLLSLPLILAGVILMIWSYRARS
jgi:phosphatidylglycerol:prolipoprotein diacylglycerol transferase